MASLASFARCGRSAVGAGGCAETRPASPSVKIQARAGATLRKLTTIAWLPANTTMRRDLDAILPQRLVRLNRGISTNASLPKRPQSTCSSHSHFGRAALGSGEASRPSQAHLSLEAVTSLRHWRKCCFRRAEEHEPPVRLHDVGIEVAVGPSASGVELAE